MEEIAAACQAYAAATQNAVNGCEMTVEDFNHLIVEKIGNLLPPPPPKELIIYGKNLSIPI